MSSRSKRRFQYPGEICRANERIIDTLEITLFEPIPMPSVGLAAVNSIASTIKSMKAPPQPLKGTVPSTIVPELVQEIKNRMYKNFSFSTAVTVINQPLGLRDLGIVGDAMTVIAVGGGFTYRMNSQSNDPTPAFIGEQETDFELDEIYITGLGPGTGIMRVNWNPDLITIKP